MADNTNQQLNQASRLVNEIDALMSALYRASIIAREIASAGITFSDQVFEGTSLSHLTAASIGNAASNAESLLAYMEAGNIDDVFNAVRP